jgi:hypothetical protein
MPFSIYWKLTTKKARRANLLVPAGDFYHEILIFTAPFPHCLPLQKMSSLGTNNSMNQG